MSAENVEWFTLYPNKTLIRLSESGPWSREMADTILRRCSMLIMVVIVLSLVACGQENLSQSPGTKVCQDGGVVIEVEPVKVIWLGGARDKEHILPGQVDLYKGESVRIVSLDHRVHSVSFVRDSLSSEMENFLSETGQLILAPLLIQGSCLSLHFHGAPAGDYVFLSRSHGQPVFGKIIIH